MTPADRCDACSGGCRSLTVCRSKCGLILEPGSETQASAPVSRKRRRLENTATVAAILTLTAVPTLSLWLAGAFAS